MSTTAQKIKDLEAAINSPATPDNLKEQMRLTLNKLKAQDANTQTDDKITDKPKRKRRTKAQMEADKKTEKPIQPKRKRRTKAQMEADGKKSNSIKSKPVKTESKTPHTSKPDSNQKIDNPDNFVKKNLDAAIGKTMYYKPDKTWIKAKIDDILPQNKDKQNWNIEFYPVGSKNDFALPLVSNTLSTHQLAQFLNNKPVKLYSLSVPDKDSVYTSWQDAVNEIDKCAEEAKAERLEKKRTAPPPVKKTASKILADKFESLQNFALKQADKKFPDKAVELQKILTRHKKELDDFFKQNKK